MYRLITLSLLLSLPLNAQELIFSNGFENTLPVIISTAVTEGEVGVAYAYDVDATDANGDLLAYYLLNSPAGMEMDAVTGEISWTPSKAGDFPVTVEVADGQRGFANQSWSIVVLTPDPVDIAPDIDPTVVTTIFHSTEFLYTGDYPIQTGVKEGTIDPVRAVAVRGKVMTRDEVPLPGVEITILDHAEYGQTMSRSDGLFDMVINGGGLLTINYTAEGFLPAQRQLDTPWQDFVIAPDVALVTLDPIVTTIDMNSGAMQMAQGSMESDADGERHAIVMFPQGTTAELVMQDGTTQPISSLNVRATEYTVGPNGPAAMPGDLPPSSGYTYAVELSADEAIAAGAKDIQFNQPVFNYVDNFLSFPAGTAVPAGYYDRNLGQWIAAPDGLVIDIIGVSEGMADIDIDGSGSAANETTLSDLGIDAAERVQLVSLYNPGDSLWRVPVKHFTPWDYNWPYGLPFGASFPGQPYSGTGSVYGGSCEAIAGSFIDCQNQALGEIIGVQGTPFTLNYRSNRQPGYASLRETNIQLSGNSVPDSLARIDLDIYVAGQHERYSYSPLTNLDHFFSWDGLDAYGRPVVGTHQVNGRISYVYPAVYNASAETRANNFGIPGDGENIGANRSALEIFLTQDFSLPFGGATTAGQVFGGWSLDIHHSYDAQARTLYLGDGRQRDAKVQGPVVKLLVEEGECWDDSDGVLEGVPLNETCMRDIYDIDTGLDGKTYLIMNECIVRIETDMTVTRIGGVPDDSYPAICKGDNSGFLPLEGVARETAIRPLDIAAGADGSVYFTDGNRVGRIRPDGMLAHVAGTGNLGGNFDTGVATEIDLNGHTYNDIAVGPDGAIYLSQYIANGYEGIRRVDPNGELTIYYKVGEVGCSLNETCATQEAGPLDLTVGLDGRVYFRDKKAYIWAVETDGSLSLIGGLGPCLPDYSDRSKGADCGDGGPAVDAGFWSIKGNLDIDQDGSLLLLDQRAVRRITPDGIITYAAGVHFLDSNGYSADGWLAAQIAFQSEWGAVMPDGTLLLAQTYKSLYAISPTMPGFNNGEVGIASEDGRALYVFDSTGRHLSTLNALTGAVLYEFSYNSEGQLVAVADADNNITTIERDSSGKPTALIAPFGQQTNIALDTNGYLESLTQALSREKWQFEYAAGGLLNATINPLGDRSEYDYDGRGFLVEYRNPEIGVQSFDRAALANGFEITRTVAVGLPGERQFKYRVERLKTGEYQWNTTAPSSEQTQISTFSDGTRTKIEPTGLSVTQKLGPESRFGMQAPLIKSEIIQLPGSLTANYDQIEEVTLSDPQDPASMTSRLNTAVFNGRTYTKNYEAASRITIETTPVVRIRTTIQDMAGRPTSVNYGPGVDSVLFDYDANGRLTSVSQGSSQKLIEYDLKGRKSAVENALGERLEFSYDDSDRPISVKLPGNEIWGFESNSMNRLTRIISPVGGEHSFDYDSNRQLTQYTAPDSEVFNYLYDTDKRLKSVTYPSGATLAYSYDEQRISEISSPQASVLFDYTNATGTLAAVNREEADAVVHTINFSYDGPLVTLQSTAAASYAYQYDNNFRVVQATLTSGADNVVQSLNYDDDSLLTGFGPFTWDRSGPAGAIKDITDGIVTVTNTYDAQGRVSGRSYSIDGSDFYSFQLGFDDAQRVIQRDETVGGSGQIRVFRYDLNGQLEEVELDTILMEQYGYDANGNRTNANGATVSFNSRNQVTTVGAVSYTFGVDGYLVNRGADSFTYSALGELLSATIAGQTVTYEHDGLGRIVSRTVDGNITSYFYGHPDVSSVITASRDHVGILSVYYYDNSTQLYAIQRGGAWYYVGVDQVGSPRVVVDSSSVVQKIIEYDGFGLVLSDSNGAFELPVGFSSGFYDPVTGLVRFGARDYDPKSGSWTAQDPSLFASGQYNFYVYAENDPVNRRDLTGRASAFGKFINEVVDDVKKFLKKKEKIEKPINQFDDFIKKSEIVMDKSIELDLSYNDSTKPSGEKGAEFFDCFLDFFEGVQPIEITPISVVKETLQRGLDALKLWVSPDGTMGKANEIEAGLPQ